MDNHVTDVIVSPRDIESPFVSDDRPAQPGFLRLGDICCAHFSSLLEPSGTPNLKLHYRLVVVAAPPLFNFDATTKHHAAGVCIGHLAQVHARSLAPNILLSYS